MSGKEKPKRKTTCNICGSTFHISNNKKCVNYCSRCYRKKYKESHYKNIPKVKHVCKRCQKTFLGTNRKHDYCSTKCYHLDYYNVQAGKKGICKCCEKEFIKSKSCHVFCSVNCNNKYLLLKMTPKEKEAHRKRVNYLYHKRNPKKTYSKECLYCNKRFDTTHKQRLYCCNGCSTKSYRKQPKVIAMRRHEANKRRHQKKSLNNFTVGQWEKAKAHFKNRCSYCGKESKKLQQDHFISLKHGGLYTQNNIVPACPSCNHRKNSKDPREWLTLNFKNGKKIYNEIMRYLAQY